MKLAQDKLLTFVVIVLYLATTTYSYETQYQQITFEEGTLNTSIFPCHSPDKGQFHILTNLKYTPLLSPPMVLLITYLHNISGINSPTTLVIGSLWSFVMSCFKPIYVVCAIMWRNFLNELAGISNFSPHTSFCILTGNEKVLVRKPPIKRKKLT